MRSLGLLLRGRVRFPRDEIGRKLTMEDGAEFTVFRHALVKGDREPAAAFVVRFTPAHMSVRQNIRFSLLPVLPLLGQHGFREKVLVRQQPRLRLAPDHRPDQPAVLRTCVVTHTRIRAEDAETDGRPSWAANVRAVGELTLSRGSHMTAYTAVEASTAAAVPVLRKYMQQIRVTRPYFNASPDSDDAAIAAELPRHPVFQLTPR